MIYYLVFITGLAGFLLGTVCTEKIRTKTKTHKDSKHCENKKCLINRQYGDFLEYDGSEKA